MNQTAQEYWSGRIGFVLAAMGSAVGLGSIWKFPYETGANGGGVFIVFYAIGLVLIAMPLMLAEFAIGRAGRADAMQSIANVARGAGASTRWRWIGGLGILTSALILTFYSVIGGWTLAYALDIAALSQPVPDAAGLRARFDALTSSPWRLGFYHSLFMLATAVIVLRGIRNGIEVASKWLMPLLVVLLIVLAAYSALRGDFGAAVRFLFVPDFSRLTPKVAMEALGLGLFSIGVGLAVMVTYASYADERIDLRQAAIYTLVCDTTISLIAGLAIFPIVFAEGIDPSSGPGLMFVSIPLAFGKAPFGALAAQMFFVLLAIAALSSAISLLEMPVAFFRRHFGWSRTRAAIVAAAICWAGGWASILSFNIFAGARPLAFVPAFASYTIFDAIDHLTSNVLLPGGAFALALFAGWALPARVITDQLTLDPPRATRLRFLMRYVTPGAIALVTLWQAF